MKARFKIIDKVWICATTKHAYEAVNAMGRTVYFHGCALRKYGIDKELEIGDWVMVEDYENDESIKSMEVVGGEE